MNKQRLLLLLCAVGAILLGIIGFVIGKGSGGSKANGETVSATKVIKETTWTCSMHPQIKLKKPGKCPICAMDLIPLKPGGNLGDREIKLSPLAEKLANIEVMPVIRKEFYMEVPMVGKISLDETRSKTITARYAGRLDRLFVDYTGIQVKKDDHLFEIYSPQLVNAQEELAQAIESAQAMKNSSVEAIRTSSLKAVDASREKLRLWGLTGEQIKHFEKTKTITDHVTSFSPIEGVVVKKHVDEGSYVKEGSVIYSIASLDYLWVELDAYETDLQWLHYAQEVVFTTEAYPGEEFKGRVSFINPLLNDKTRTVKVRVNVENKDRRLKPDMFVRAEVRVNVNAAGKVIDRALSGKWISPMHPEIISDKPGPCKVCGMDLVPAHEYGFSSLNEKTENPLLIPASAPLITGKRAVVYTKSITNEGIYQGRTVTLGLKAGDYYIVKSGLRQGELVVTKGAFKIDSALQIQAKPSMMSLEGSNEMETFETSLPFKKSLANVYEIYDQISKELSKDSMKGLAVKAEALLKGLAEIKAENEEAKTAEFWEKKSKEIELATNVIKTSTDIKASRKNFENLSQAVIELVQSLGTIDDINLAFCSMAFNDKGAYWLQKSSEVENPYFGSQMYHCGDIKKTYSYQLKSVQYSEKNRGILAGSFEGYQHLSEMLSKDKIPSLEKLKSFQLKIQSVNMKLMSEETHLAFMKESGKIKSSIDKLSDKSKLNEHRLVFEEISKSYISLMKIAPFLKVEAYVVHCPMTFDGKGADWLQLNEKAVNPYLGLDMQGCGDVKSSFKPIEEKKQKEVIEQTPKHDHQEHLEKPVKNKIDPKKDLDKKATPKVPTEPKEMHKHDHSKMQPKFPEAAFQVYLKVHKALSQDRFPESGKEILIQSLKTLKSSDGALKAVDSLYSSKNIKEVRIAFQTITQSLIQFSDKGLLPLDLNLAHCPMAFGGKGGNWLQTGDKVENPYFGSQMYRCGEIKKKIAGSK